MSKPLFQRMSQEQPTLLKHNTALDIYSEPHEFRQCSIVCTIGPKTKSVEMITKLRKAGMNVCRMNFSHGSYEYHGEVVANARKSCEVEPLDGTPIAIALDTKGPEIRTGMLVGEDPLLEKGSKVMVHTDDAWFEKCDGSNVYMDYKNLPKVMQPGQLIYVDDGLISLKVESIDLAAGSLACEVLNSGKLGSKKGCNLPNVDVDLPALSEKDKSDLAFGIEQGVDMVFASFIRKAQDVKDVRECLVEASERITGSKTLGERIKIISKIESHEGMRNFDEVLAETDGVMVARGDLGIEIPPQKVFVAQKMMIAKCNLAAKPVICATQMLESMTFNPRPTRAEVSDVANAVLDGADCVMLSGETAKGNYPIEAVTMMSETCREAESATCYRQLSLDLKEAMQTPLDTPMGVAAAAVNAAEAIEASAIICLSVTGATAAFCAKYRSRCPIFIVSRDGLTVRQAALNRGCVPMLYKEEKMEPWEADVNARIHWAMQEGIKRGLLKTKESVVAVHGWKAGGGGTNTIRILEVA